MFFARVNRPFLLPCSRPGDCWRIDVDAGVGTRLRDGLQMPVNAALLAGALRVGALTLIPHLLHLVTRRLA